MSSECLLEEIAGRSFVFDFQRELWLVGQLVEIGTESTWGE